MRLLTLELKNFLSYRDTVLELGDITALVGPNASGKSNAVAALKLLGDIPKYGLQTALLRRGGFDQVRHRSQGRPFDPAITVEFAADDDLSRISRYELQLGSLSGGRYEVKHERIELCLEKGQYHLSSTKGRVDLSFTDDANGRFRPPERFAVPQGQSLVGLTASYYPLLPLWDLLTSIQVVEVNSARMRELQEPTPGQSMDPDGANATSVFETLSSSRRQELADELAAIVPGVCEIDVRRFANKLTLRFSQQVRESKRQFLASQVSDGTLRAFGVLLPFFQPSRPTLLVVEEPESAIHLGALRTLVQVLREHSDEVQVLLTTHSADVIDELGIEQVRVVWTEDGVSRIAPVAAHTIETIKGGLITPGELLRSDALDPVGA